MSATMLVTLAVISLLTAAIAARSAAARVDADVARIANTLRTTNFPLTPAVLEKIAGLSGAELLATDAANQVTSSTPLISASGWQPAASRSNDDAALADRVQLGDEAYFHRVVALTRPPKQGESAWLHVLYPESAWRQARREAIYPPLLIGGIGAAATALFSLILSRRVTRPMSRIAALMENLAAGAYVPAELPRRNDELRDLTVVANRLAAQLDELHRAIRRGERLALLGQLSGGLAHQMRNSATGARLAMQLHRRSCTDDDRATIDVALRQLDLVEEHLSAFLALGMPRPPRFEACPLSPIVRDVERLVAANCRHRGVDLQVTLPATEAVVLADAQQLRQLLINLTLNAVDAADRQGHVRVVLETLERETHRTEARLAVYDNGPGVAGDVADSLFEPFVTTKPEGVGLGLAVAARIAVDHGGRLAHTRVQGETCFEYFLPVYAASQGVHGTPAETQPTTPPARQVAAAESHTEPSHA